MDSIDWIAMGFMAALGLGLLAGFFFYLRYAFRAGGWRRVGRDLAIAIVAIGLFALRGYLRNR